MRTGEILFGLLNTAYITMVIFLEYGSNRRRKEEIRFLRSFGDLLSAVIHHYFRTGSVYEAVSCSADELRRQDGREREDTGGPVADMAERLTGMLRAGNTLALMREYLETDAHRYLKLFVSIASYVAENGDTGDDHAKGSVFIDSVMQLKKDVSEDERRLAMKQHAFRGLTLLASLPIVTVPLIADWCSETVPGLLGFYYGRTGGIIRLLLFLGSMTAYVFVVFLRDGRWRMVPPVQRLEAGATAIIAGVFMFMVSVAVTVCGHASMRNILVNDVSQIENSFEIADSRVIRAMCLYTPVCMNRLIEGKTMPDSNSLIEELVNDPSVPDREAAHEIASLVLNRYEQYKKEHFDLTDVLISVFMGILGYILPWAVPACFSILSRERRNDEIRHFCTLIHMQKSIPGMTTDRLLESICNASDQFKPLICECLYTLGISEIKAFGLLRSGCREVKLKRLADSFEMIDEVGIEDAFAETSSQITEFAEDIRCERRIAEENEGMLAKMIAVLPGAAILFGYLMLPFIIGALKLFEESMLQMEGLI